MLFQSIAYKHLAVLQFLKTMTPLPTKYLSYNLRAKDLLQLRKTRTVLNRLNSIVFRGSILWNSIPDKIMSSQSIASFKAQMRLWNGDSCS